MYQPSKYLFAFFLCLSSYALGANQKMILPKQAKVPGGVAIIALDIKSQEPPIVRYQKVRTLVMNDPDKPESWLTIVGIPLDAQPGVHKIEITNASGTKRKYKHFSVTNKNYKNERLTIADKRKVLPLAQDLPIIKKQYVETIQSYAHWEYQPITSAVFSLPVKGRKSSPYGLIRIMNNIPLNPHSGLDIAAPKGTPVHAPKQGVVTNVGEYFYNGKIVFLDHGQGLVTSYCHLDTINVVKGQKVKEGDILGTIGATGRATGPHLHWSISLNNTRVDPQWFIYE